MGIKLRPNLQHKINVFLRDVTEEFDTKFISASEQDKFVKLFYYLENRDRKSYQTVLSSLKMYFTSHINCCKI